MNKQFIIPFIGLKIGKHDFEFEIETSFFESIEHSMIQKGNLSVSLTLEKKETMLIAFFEAEGTIETICDRCDTSMDLDIYGSYRLIYKFGLEEEEDETLVVLHPDSYQIDVTMPIYELVASQIPLRVKHDEGECDEEMWALIQKHTINANEEEPSEFMDDDRDEDDEDFEEDEIDDEADTSLDEGEEEPDNDKPIDPRWSILKNLN
jgi:uncharacterized metal-binding protein YceD (DUF177 family)